MSDLINQIQRAQVIAGEDAVLRDLQKSGLLTGKAVIPEPPQGTFYDMVTMNGAMLQDACHNAAVASGWWKNLQTGEDLRHVSADGLKAIKSGDTKFNVPEKLCLIHSEISEGMEGFRKGLKDDKLPHRDMLEVELADAVIRAFDLAGGLGYDLGATIAEKLQVNAKRADHKIENRKAEGGKAF